MYTYNSNGDPEMERLASLCLERIPSFHKWYFQTMNHKTFGFLMEESYVYFTIADEGLGNSGVHSFLKHVMEEFRKASKKGGTLRRTMSNLTNPHALQDQLLPIVHRLIASLEKVSQNRTEWPTEALSCDNNANGRQNEASVSTKMPLLGRPGKHEKRKMKDHHHMIELEDRGIKIDNDSGSTDSSSGQSGPISSSALQKESGLRRSLSGGQNARRKWCRQVRIILAIDAFLCLIMLAVWLVICRGIQCLQ